MSMTPPKRLPNSAGKPPVMTFAESMTIGLRPAENGTCAFSQKETPLITGLSATSWPRTCTKSSWPRIIPGAAVTSASGRFAWWSGAEVRYPRAGEHGRAGRVRPRQRLSLAGDLYRHFDRAQIERERDRADTREARAPDAARAARTPPTPRPARSRRVQSAAARNARWRRPGPAARRRPHRASSTSPSRLTGPTRRPLRPPGRGRPPRSARKRRRPRKESARGDPPERLPIEIPGTYPRPPSTMNGMDRHGRPWSRRPHPPVAIACQLFEDLKIALTRAAAEGWEGMPEPAWKADRFG